MPSSWFCKHLLTQQGWKSDTRIEVDNEGKITSIDYNAVPVANDTTLDGWVIPGIPNAHSHAFQYAMVGLTETAGSSQENFWTWRSKMYNLALSLSPEQVGIIAEALYCEMLRHGYTAVAEFHYLHHDPNGERYNSLDEIGSELFAAADRVGMGLCLVPVYYQRSNFSQTSALPEQRRFTFKNIDEYMMLLEMLRKKGPVGSGAHSLRAASIEDISAIAQLNFIPFHIHIAEQLKEVRDCENATGKRPVSYFLDNVALTRSTYLVHATHLDQSELVGLAQSDATVVICPSTEGNLADGIFPLPQYLELGGRICIGSDSQIGLNPFEEMRWMDYQHRLLSNSRAPLNLPRGENGDHILGRCLTAGLGAVGRSERYFQVGNQFDGIEINANAPAFVARNTDKFLSTLVYHGSPLHIKRVVAKGKIRIEDGIHPRDHIIREKFRSVMNDLSNKF